VLTGCGIQVGQDYLFYLCALTGCPGSGFIQKTVGVAAAARAAGNTQQL
jgi:hypothetical protein